MTVIGNKIGSEPTKAIGSTPGRWLRKTSRVTTQISTLADQLWILTRELDDALSNENDHSNVSVGIDAVVVVQQYLKMRRHREREFPKLFSDPGWDMILLLYVARKTGRKIKTSAIAGLINVPGTTSLRYIGLLEARCLIERMRDPRDARRKWVSLSTYGCELVEGWVSTMVRQLAIVAD